MYRKGDLHRRRLEALGEHGPVVVAVDAMVINSSIPRTPVSPAAGTAYCPSHPATWIGTYQHIYRSAMANGRKNILMLSEGVNHTSIVRPVICDPQVTCSAWYAHKSNKSPSNRGDVLTREGGAVR